MKLEDWIEPYLDEDKEVYIIPSYKISRIQRELDEITNELDAFGGYLITIKAPSAVLKEFKKMRELIKR